MQKPIAIIDQEPKLKEISNRMHEVSTQYKERMEFLRKQADDIQAQADKAMEPLWKEMQDYLLGSGKIGKEYLNKDKFHFHLAEDVGLLMVCDGEHKDPRSVIIDLLQGQ